MLTELPRELIRTIGEWLDKNVDALALALVCHELAESLGVDLGKRRRALAATRIQRCWRRRNLCLVEQYDGDPVLAHHVKWKYFFENVTRNLINNRRVDSLSWSANAFKRNTINQWVRIASTTQCDSDHHLFILRWPFICDLLLEIYIRLDSVRLSGVAVSILIGDVDVSANVRRVILVPKGDATIVSVQFDKPVALCWVDRGITLSVHLPAERIPETMNDSRITVWLRGTHVGPASRMRGRSVDVKDAHLHYHPNPFSLSAHPRSLCRPDICGTDACGNDESVLTRIEWRT